LWERYFTTFEPASPSQALQNPQSPEKQLATIFFFLLNALLSLIYFFLFKILL